MKPRCGANEGVREKLRKTFSSNAFLRKEIIEIIISTMESGSSLP
jgi:hypothetical protein